MSRGSPGHNSSPQRPYPFFIFAITLIFVALVAIAAVRVLIAYDRPEDLAIRITLLAAIAVVAALALARLIRLPSQAKGPQDTEQHRGRPTSGSS